ncbi:hypothetical protein [Paenibacillus sp. MER 99-2]|uniref:hypothetical protein n=1 Tax=Paenibacillus sp. MER 99-2 TaxID=2939572 RepID=UPI00203F5A40|nr:hypothetical protein [Paenibacillus sp. MER 99-2]MCM3174246.1 hypothetical protein [Paenibacillus sp. MER 99-2]
MSTSTSWDQEEERMYNELRALVEEVEGQEQRRKMLNRMIKQLLNARWRKKILNMDNHPFSNLRPAQLGIMITTGALAPIVLFCIFIWLSLWVE